VVFDDCNDNSVNITTRLLASAVPPANLVHILLINQPTPVWETSANNIGLRAAHAKSQFLVLVQDDMQMLWQGWNTLLALPMRLYPNILAVSGRCGHRQYSQGSQGVSSFAGRCGQDINSPLAASPATLCTFHIRDTVNRGPLLYNSTKIAELGFFDEVSKKPTRPYIAYQRV
jgi:hypothetical protein